MPPCSFAPACHPRGGTCQNAIHVLRMLLCTRGVAVPALAFSLLALTARLLSPVFASIYAVGTCSCCHRWDSCALRVSDKQLPAVLKRLWPQSSSSAEALGIRQHARVPSNDGAHVLLCPEARGATSTAAQQLSQRPIHGCLLRPAGCLPRRSRAGCQTLASILRLASPSSLRPPTT